MESVLRMKRSLTRPIRRLTSCVSVGMKERRLCAKPRNKQQTRGGGGRGGRRSLGKKNQLKTAYPKDPTVIRSYQADLEKKRKQREAMNAQKNAQRAAMRDHFRRKYQLSENTEDMNHLKSVGRKVSLPHELSKIIHPETKTKGEGFNLLSAFRGLSFDTMLLTGRENGKTSTPSPTNGESCRVM